MKKLPIIIATLIAASMAGCKPNTKPQSPVEARFERYVKSENLTDKIISVDSVVLVDSISLISMLNKIDSMSDSVDECLMDAIREIPKLGQARNEEEAITVTKFALTYADITNGEQHNKAKALKGQILEFIDDNDETKCYKLFHKIYARTPQGQDVYNALTLGYQDTILIFKDEDYREARTTKSDRIDSYLMNYMTESFSSRAVLLDEVKEFIKNY